MIAILIGRDPTLPLPRSKRNDQFKFETVRTTTKERTQKMKTTQSLEKNQKGLKDSNIRGPLAVATSITITGGTEAAQNKND